MKHAFSTNNEMYTARERILDTALPYKIVIYFELFDVYISPLTVMGK